MSNIANTYDALQRTIELIGKHHGMRKKADGMNSTMPDDPSGDGFRDITTGAHYEEMTNEYEKLMPMPPDAPTAYAQALAEDNQQDHSNSDFNVTSSGEGISGQEYCKAYKEDPQGTDMPAEAGEEKYAEYLNYSFEENVAGFNKAASYILANAYAPRQQINYGGYTQKTAAAAQLQQQTDYVYNTAVNHMAPLSDADLIKTAEDVDNAIQSIYDGMEQEKTATAQLNVQDYTTLQNMSVEELNELTCRASDALTKYAEEVATDDVPMEDELGALQALSPEEIQLLAQLPEEELEELIMTAAGEEQNAALESNPDIAEEAQAISDLPEEDIDALASMPEEKLASFIYKLAEDIADESAADPAAMMEEGGVGALDPAMMEDAGIPDNIEQEIIEALADAPPEALEALDQMSPEELGDVIQELEAIEGNDAALEEVAQSGALGGGGGDMGGACAGGNCAPEDEAINELSSAMTEEQVTPDELAQLGKEGSAQRLHMQKLAKRVKELRDSGRYLYSYPKTAKAAALRQQMHSFLKEVTRL